MTDDPSHEERLDLGILEAGRGEGDDRVMHAVMLQIARRGEETATLLRARRVLFAAAAVLAVLAATSVLATRDRPRADAMAGVIAEWLRVGHVPTNGELLAAYHGYRQ
jgi:hypothetical protein